MFCLLAEINILLLGLLRTITYHHLDCSRRERKTVLAFAGVLRAAGEVEHQPA